MLLHTKEPFWKFAFRYFFPLERGLNTGRWPRNNTSQWPPVHISPQKALLFSTKPLGCPTVMEKTSRCWPRTPGPPHGLRHTHNSVWPVLMFRNMWMRMTFNFTQHKREMEFKLDLFCFEFQVPFHYNTVQNYLPISSFLSICPLYFNVNPNSDKSATSWYW